MGNTIIRASHVGAVYHQVSAYYGTPTDEDIEIAKRAAILTKKKWAEERRRKEKKLEFTGGRFTNCQSDLLTGNIRKENAQSTRKNPKENEKKISIMLGNFTFTSAKTWYYRRGIFTSHERTTKAPFGYVMTQVHLIHKKGRYAVRH